MLIEWEDTGVVNRILRIFLWMHPKSKEYRSELSFLQFQVLYNEIYST